ncbi:MAG: hypothetical protein ACXV8W_14200 [Methylobacter sp.]
MIKYFIEVVVVKIIFPITAALFAWYKWFKSEYNQKRYERYDLIWKRIVVGDSDWGHVTTTSKFKNTSDEITEKVTEEKTFTPRLNLQSISILELKNYPEFKESIELNLKHLRKTWETETKEDYKIIDDSIDSVLKYYEMPRSTLLDRVKNHFKRFDHSRSAK